MIGIILSFVFAASYLTVAWDGFESGLEVLPALGSAGAWVLIGLIFPRTIGIALTPVILLTPVAFVIALVRFGFSHAFSVLLVGVGAIVASQIIAAVRPDAVGYRLQK